MRESNFSAYNPKKTLYPVLLATSFTHLCNDTLQAVVPAMYPVFKESHGLTFSQIGLVTLTYQLTASFLQPIVGIYTDKNPKPFSLLVGLILSALGLFFLSYAMSFYTMLLSVVLIGMGSSIFHPEASRIAYLGSGGKRGLAQSIFQLGGNFGTAIGPLLVAMFIVPKGQRWILLSLVMVVLGMFVVAPLGRWYSGVLQQISHKKLGNLSRPRLSKRKIQISIVILLILIFSKSFYTASMSSYYTFFLIEKFQLTVVNAQMHLFYFLGAVALGTLLGGPLGDVIGRKYIIWFSILGAAPFALAMPYADLYWTNILAMLVGFILASAFSAILVYAQELLPNHIGMVSGLFFGFAFGMGGLGSAILGWMADLYSIEKVYQLCAFLPLIGIITYFLPNIKRLK